MQELSLARCKQLMLAVAGRQRSVPQPPQPWPTDCWSATDRYSYRPQNSPRRPAQTWSQPSPAVRVRPIVNRARTDHRSTNHKTTPQLPLQPTTAGVRRMRSKAQVRIARPASHARSRLCGDMLVTHPTLAHIIRSTRVKWEYNIGNRHYASCVTFVT